MPRLSPVSRKDLIRKLRGIGFSGPHTATKHEYMWKKGEKIFIPNPHGKDIGIPIIKEIIKQLNISVEEFMEL